jgi:hypothetical protein
MLTEFARCYEDKIGEHFDVQKRHIRYYIFQLSLQVMFSDDGFAAFARCLAHIINLATQAMISTRSKAKYYNPHNIDEHAPDVNAVERDELGLIRAISVKVSFVTSSMDHS